MTDSVCECKRSCRAAERRWRKMGSDVHHNVYRDRVLAFNSAMRSAKRACLSRITSDSNNNPRTPFTTINTLLNPAPANDLLDQASSARCGEVAIFFLVGLSGSVLDISRRKIFVTVSDHASGKYD